MLLHSNRFGFVTQTGLPSKSQLSGDILADSDVILQGRKSLLCITLCFLILAVFNLAFKGRDRFLVALQFFPEVGVVELSARQFLEFAHLVTFGRTRFRG